MPQRKPEVTRRTAAGIPYELTRKKVKRLNLHIRRDGTVAVSIPWSYTVGFADAFVTEQAQWIREAAEHHIVQVLLSPAQQICHILPTYG